MLTHAEYNAKVQDMQSFCISAGLESRVIDNRMLFSSDVPSHFYRGPRPSEKLTHAYFQVYWDGRWMTLGKEVPFAKTDAERKGEYWEMIDLKIRSQVADSILR